MQVLQVKHGVCVGGFADQFLPNRMLTRLSSNLQKLFCKTTLLLFSCV